MATFQERLKKLRNGHGLKKVIGVDKNTIYRRESGRNHASEENRLFLTHFFNVPYAYMMGISYDPTEVVLTDEEEAEEQKLEVEQDGSSC